MRRKDRMKEENRKAKDVKRMDRREGDERGG